MAGYGGYFGSSEKKRKIIAQETGIVGTSFKSPTAGTGKKKKAKKKK